MFEAARLCVDLGHLPEAGGLDEQDPVMVDALDIVRRERPRSRA